MDGPADRYDALRQAARRKRDLAIAEVKATYRRELTTIKQLRESLEKMLPSKRGPAPRHGGPKLRSLAELVRQHMPADQPFTVDEIVTILAEAEPERRLSRNSLRVAISTLDRAGYIRKVKLLGGRQVVWEATGKQAPETPFTALTIPDAVAVILAENGAPMRLLEIVVALHGRGYRRETDLRVLVKGVEATLRRCRGRFQGTGDGQWTWADDC